MANKAKAIRRTVEKTIKGVKQQVLQFKVDFERACNSDELAKALPAILSRIYPLRVSWLRPLAFDDSLGGPEVSVTSWGRLVSFWNDRLGLEVADDLDNIPVVTVRQNRVAYRTGSQSAEIEIRREGVGRFRIIGAVWHDVGEDAAGNVNGHKVSGLIKGLETEGCSAEIRREQEPVAAGDAAAATA